MELTALHKEFEQYYASFDNQEAFWVEKIQQVITACVSRYADLHRQGNG